MNRALSKREALLPSLDEIVDRGREDFERLRGTRILVTGGTGFVGSWLLSSLLHANRRLDTRLRAVVLTRDVRSYREAMPEIASDSAIELRSGDVRDRNAFDVGSVDAVIHAATSADAKTNAANPMALLETVIDGTRFALDAARASGSIPFLLTSSGAVYGVQPANIALLAETDVRGPDQLDLRFVYHESKRTAEQLCAIAAATTELRPTIARLFAFVGPFLPLDRHLAIGNFMRDALAGGPIVIGGDGTPVRTYLYGGDLASWMWRILVRGRSGRAYNVGAERTVDIAETARIVAEASEAAPAVVVRGIADPARLAERYAPSTRRAREELELAEWTNLEEAVRRSLRWHRA